MKTALTIAGSDPTGGAGVQMDLRVFHRIGVHGLSVISALTAQNTMGVVSIHPLPAEYVKAQIDAVIEDLRIDALKTGMLYSWDVVETVTDAVRRESLRNLVIDPVTISSSGMPLIKDGVIAQMVHALLPHARVITPNIYEASLITGLNIGGVEDMQAAAERIRHLGPEVVIITGGHLTEDIAIDLYFDGVDFHRIESRRYPGEYHGTGCAFSSAVTAYLALGKTPLEASRLAKELITQAIYKAYHIGRGMGLLRI